MIRAENVKRIDMVDFLTSHYGLSFTGKGRQYACLSPFKEEKSPSFFVRQVDGHWLFKDFSSGHGGSLIDFVLLKENLCEVSAALLHIEQSLSGNGGSKAGAVASSGGNNAADRKTVSYDVIKIYEKLRVNDSGICGDYLLSRGINEELILKLRDKGLLLHNRYDGISYCCFAVFNHHGQLCCLDNHQVDGERKFVLGKKCCFSLDWKELPTSGEVFVTEGIIDYLSVKTLKDSNYPGLALLGNVVNFGSAHFGSASVIVSALDGDEGGFRAFLDLEEQFDGKEIRVMDFGESKDANEYLQEQRSGKVRRLSAGEKVTLYKEFQQSSNKTELARKWGINRSYMYEVVKECEQLLLEGFSSRRRGRKPEGAPVSYNEALDHINRLEMEKRQLGEERERFFVRNEFMKLRLKWSEREVSELQSKSEGVIGEQPKAVKRQKKKKKRRKR